MMEAVSAAGNPLNLLKINNVKADNHYMRNPILASFTAKHPPYRGLCSSLLRALRGSPHIDLIDDRADYLFKAIVTRPRALTALAPSTVTEECAV